MSIFLSLTFTFFTQKCIKILTKHLSFWGTCRPLSGPPPLDPTEYCDIPRGKHFLCVCLLFVVYCLQHQTLYTFCSVVTVTNIHCDALVQDAWLNWTLKLILMISLSIHMMTIQDRICVQCVTNGSHRKEIWMFTNEFTAEISHLYVVIVANNSQRLDIWIDTAEFTVRRNHTNVPRVTRHLVFLEM